MIRPRDTFALYKVDYRNNFARTFTALVWAHTFHDAVRVVDEYASQQARHFMSEVLNVSVVNSPDSDTEDYASIAWVGGETPTWT